MNPNDKYICIYHANCHDGIAAAWVVRKFLKDCNVSFIPANYQEPPPNVIGANVIIVDFSYKRPVIEEMAKSAKSIFIIDHHKSAQEDLTSASLPANVDVHFDMAHSGAMLTWQCFFEDIQPPMILRYIEDRDLWKFEYSGTRFVHMGLAKEIVSFEKLDDLQDLENLEQLIDEGYILHTKYENDLATLLVQTSRRLMIAGYNVSAANLPHMFASDAGNILSVNEPFAATYYDSPKGRHFSLRSQPDGKDVSEIAAQYGGGGHKHAAGFVISIQRAQAFELEYNDRRPLI